MSTETLIGELDGSGQHLDDDVVDALADGQRRAVLRTMLDEESADLREVARSVARRKHDDPPSDGALERLKVALHHRHLPKLADAGLVEYDHRNRAVALAIDAASLRAVLG